MTTPVFDATRHNGLQDVPAERFETFYKRITSEEWESRYSALGLYVPKHAK